MSDEVIHDTELSEVKSVNDEKHDEIKDELLEGHEKIPIYPERISRIWSILRTWKKSILAVLCSIFVLGIMVSIVLIVEIFDKQKMKPYNGLILISIDGFQSEYLHKFEGLELPNLRSLIASGSYTRFMEPVFPSLTFPNHFSIISGLYAETHGIVSNNMFDPVLNASYSMGSSEVDPSLWYEQIEPIWVTAELQNVTTAIMGWPGCDVKIKGILPTHYTHYDKTQTYEQRVEQLFKFIDLNPRPRFFTLYFEGVDSAGHRYGPDSPQVPEQLSLVDKMIGEVIAGLRQRDLLEVIDIIIVSDHGMSQVSNNRVIYLDDIIGTELDFQVYDVSPKHTHSTTAMIHIKDPSKVHDVYAKLKNASESNPFDVYLKENIPLRFHYRNHRRIPEILCIAQERWLFTLRSLDTPVFGQGTHGWDPREASMSAIFIANGPSFKRGFELNPFQNIQLYNLMSHILGIKPAPNNGTFELIQHILIDS